jgi:hypothetical protein
MGKSKNGQKIKKAKKNPAEVNKQDADKKTISTPKKK